MRACHADYYFAYGGYSDAERCCPIFLPEYLTPEDVVGSPDLAGITYVKADVGRFNAKAADLSHRDVLGALMGLGIERDAVGDIVADRSSALIILKSKLQDFVREHLVKIGRYPVEVTLHATYEVQPKLDYVEDCDTVASMRLDAVVAAIFCISRGSASDAVNGGIVSVNGTPQTKGDHIVAVGDKIALRGKGKALIDAIDGLSKKGRLRFRFRKYR